jgi:hypothetical protein
MIIRKIALGLVTVAALSPAVSNAGSFEKASLNACARAFATSLASPGAAAPAFKLDYLGDRTASSVTDFYPVQYSFDLEAKDPKTGLAIARARCSADSRGAVTALSAEPLEATGGTLAAQL